jgi:uncharacterized protein
MGEGNGVAAMRILVSGTSGLIGGALVASLRQAGHKVLCLVRSQPDPAQGRIAWDPSAGIAGFESIGRLDAVVHLAGAGIADERWTSERKALVRDSRVQATRQLVESFSRLADKPASFLCASAVGYYGNRGDELLDEASAPGLGFLADVCREWEAATCPASDAGIRVVNLRSGVVLSSRGGTLAKALPVFRYGLGSALGSGRQWMSWISLADEVRAISRLIEDASVSGPVNLTAPHPVTNAEFTRALGRLVHRPTFMRAPAWGLKILFGSLAEELLLSGQKVSPGKLVAMRFEFEAPTLEVALAKEIPSK